MSKPILESRAVYTKILIEFFITYIRKDSMVILRSTLPLLFAFPLLATAVEGNYFQSLQFAQDHKDPNIDREEENNIIWIQEESKKTNMRLSRIDQIPPERLKAESSSYLEGYIQALIDANYYELNVLVYVDSNQTVFLYNLPMDDRVRRSIIAFVSDLPDVEEVREGVLDPEIRQRIEERQPIRQVKGVWFPESTVLFQPLIANPREPIYSVAYRWGDILAHREIAVSLGDTFPIFRWFDILPWHGDMQIDIAACMWANFDMHPKVHPHGEWAELVTTDYLLALPLSYAVKKWAFRLRVYHISSHLGDEYLVNGGPTIERKNPSFEALDIFSSYQVNDMLRLYFGPGFILHSDQSYPMKWFYAEYGLEFRFSGFRYHYHRLYGAPFFAADIQNSQATNFRFSTTLQLGYEWSKLQGAGRKVRLFCEYHNGNSEGQFFKDHTQYIAIRASWGF